MIVNDRKPVAAGAKVEVELYAPAAAKAVVKIDGKVVADSTAKKSNTFKSSVTIPAEKKLISADLLDKDGKAIETITVNVVYK